MTRCCFSSLNREIWNDVQASARVAADNLRLNVATGVRFGKKLESYRGLDSLLATRETRPECLWPLWMPGETSFFHTENFLLPPFVPGRTLEEGDGFTLREDEGGRTLIMPVNGRDGKNAGYIGVRIDRAPLNADLYAMFRAQLAAQGAIALGGALLLACLLAAAGRGTGGSGAPGTGLAAPRDVRHRRLSSGHACQRGSRPACLQFPLYGKP